MNEKSMRRYVLLAVVLTGCADATGPNNDVPDTLARPMFTKSASACNLGDTHRSVACQAKYLAALGLTGGTVAACAGRAWRECVAGGFALPAAWHDWWTTEPGPPEPWEQSHYFSIREQRP